MILYSIIVTCLCLPISQSFYAFQLSHSTFSNLNFNTNQFRIAKLQLDLEDILEDDVNYLTQLRKQMEASLNTTPKEIYSRTKEFFGKNGKKSPEEIRQLKEFIDENKTALDSVNVILLMEGCFRFQIKFNEIISWSTILDGMEKQSSYITSTIIYKSLVCLKFINLEDANAKQFVKLLWQRIKESNVILNLSDICPSIHCLQNVMIYTPEIKEIILYLAHCISESTIPFPPKVICSAIFSLKRMKPIAEVRELIKRIAIKIEESETYIHSVNICTALDGLQCMDDAYPEIRQLLNALMNKAIPADEQGLDIAKDREISMALFGLQKMGSTERNSAGYLLHFFSPLHAPSGAYDQDLEPIQKKPRLSNGRVNDSLSPELKRVLKYMSSLLYHYDRSFEAKRLGFAMMGLSRLSSDPPEVKELLTNLTMKAHDAWGDISSQELSMCIHGIMSMHSEAMEVRGFIAALVPLIHRCQFMTKNDIRSALFGMQGMQSNCKEVIAFAEAFGDLLHCSNVTLSRPSEISGALYGLQGMNPDKPGVKKLFLEVIRMIDAVPVPSLFDGREIAMSLYALRSISTMDRDILHLIETLTLHWQQIKTPLTTQDVANIFYGLQRVKTGNVIVTNLLDAIATLMGKVEGSFNSKGISMTLNGLQGLDSAHSAVRNVCFRLASIINKDKIPSFKGFLDFHQYSSALYGFSNLSSEANAVALLLKMFAELIKMDGAVANTHVVTKPAVSKKKKASTASLEEEKLLNNAISTIQSSVDSKTLPAPEVMKSPSQGGGPSYLSLYRGKLKLQETPMAEKVGMALFGLQGMNSELEWVRDIMASLLIFIESMPPPDGKTLGMAFQAFRSCTGKPVEEYEIALSLLAKKIPGWTTRKFSKNNLLSFHRMSTSPFPSVEEVEVTLRSCLSGTMGLSRGSEAIIEVLTALASEILLYPDVIQFQKKTIVLILDAFKGAKLLKNPIINEFLDKIRSIPVDSTFEETMKPMKPAAKLPGKPWMVVSTKPKNTKVMKLVESVQSKPSGAVWRKVENPKAPILIAKEPAVHHATISDSGNESREWIPFVDYKQPGIKETNDERIEKAIFIMTNLSERLEPTV